ncbi:hypothetical protein ACWDX5_33000, partial [Streptomyces tuirus]
KDVLALTKGEIKQSLTMEFVSNEVALDPKGQPAQAQVGRRRCAGRGAARRAPSGPALQGLRRWWSAGRSRPPR